MINRFGAAALLGCVLATGTAQAANLPGVKSGDRNQVPACATPGRLLGFLKERNPKLEQRFNGVAADYMRVGMELGVRWDYAFFQMIIETGSLSFKSDGRSGDVRADQNNFAGLGAVGNGARGESFPDVTTGVTAHLQHLLIYAGEKVPNAVAERTRKVQEWGVLNSWHKTIKGPVSFGDLARKWAPGASEYGAMIEATAKRFYDDHCNRPDPSEDLVAAADVKHAVTDDQPAKISGAELARKNIAAERAESTAGNRKALGAVNVAKAITPAPAADIAPPQQKVVTTGPAITILNAPRPETIEKAPAATPQPLQASMGLQPKLPVPAATTPAASGKCRVFQASYGGQRAIIIRSKSDGYINYTVLDVNEGTAKREAEAYIQAYAKGGEPVGDFNNQGLALDKAFDLCPEG